MNNEICQIIWVSIKVALCATLAVMFWSMILATVLVTKRSKLATVCELVIYLPMAMPPVALGYGLLLLCGHDSLLGQFLYNYLGIEIAFTFLGAVLASFIVSLGIGVRTLRLTLEQIDELQIYSARLLGAKNLEIFYYIILPQCRNALFGGGILVFIRALSEFGATMVLAGNSLGSTRTLALAIWVGMETPGKERECLILVLIAASISFLALMTSEILLRQRKF
jgi:molybdate transport system permease protein